LERLKRAPVLGDGTRQNCWKDRNETKSQTSNQQRVFRCGRPRAPPRRKTARMHGTPIYVSKNGKIVAVKP